MNIQDASRWKRGTGASVRRGYAMLAVMIMILTMTGLAAVHQRHLSAALRLEQARVQSELHAQGPLRVLAIAIDRLKTGDPPNPAAYSYVHRQAGLSTTYRIEYAVAGQRWTVTAQPDGAAASLPMLPEAF